MDFSLHEKLAADCEFLGDMTVSRVLLMRDHRFPWAILVPRLAGLRDVHDLPRDQALGVFDEVGAVSRALAAGFGAEKINVAALGNQVPQLHIHVIARYAADAAWPGPVWNAGAVAAPDDAIVSRWAGTLRALLDLDAFE